MPAATLEQLETLIGSPPAPPPKKPGAGRFASLDAYRGFIMFILAANGFGWRHLAKNPDFSWIAAQFEHVPWTGLVFWDLIQPAFMFMVGVAMPFALANRLEQGASRSSIFRHVAWRSLMLILLSQVLMSVRPGARRSRLASNRFIMSGEVGSRDASMLLNSSIAAELRGAVLAFIHSITALSSRAFFTASISASGVAPRNLSRRASMTQLYL